MSASITSFNSVWGTARTVPMVPTGMKMGVWMSPWSVVRTPARALEPGILGFEGELQRVGVDDRTLPRVRSYGTPKVTWEHGRHTLQHRRRGVGASAGLGLGRQVVVGTQGQDLRGPGSLHPGHRRHDGAGNRTTHRPVPGLVSGHRGSATASNCKHASRHPTALPRHGGEAFWKP